MKRLLILALLTPMSLWSQTGKTIISEETILQLAKNEVTPELDEIKATLLQAQGQEGEANDELGTDVYAGYNYSKTKQKGLIRYMPIFSPVTQYQVGIKKNFRYGVQGNLYASTDIRSKEDNTYKNLTTKTYALEINIDLWKDLFGKLTRKKLENAKVMSKQALLQSKISEKVYNISLRRLYWNLVANSEKLKISSNLYQTSLKQARDARKRKANSIADRSEVARYESQVASRKGSMLYLDYERENILKQLRSLLPSLSQKDITLGEYSLNKTVFEVLECTSMIDRIGEVPYQYTKYDELADLLKTVQTNQAVIDDKYDDIDLKLATQFKKTGVGSVANNNGTTYEGSSAAAIDDMNKNDRSGVSYGLQLTIPLGEKGSDTKDVKKEYNKRKLRANITNMENNLVATHKQISKSIKVLAEVIKTQKENSKQLSIRVKEMQKKYNQARIPEYVLIQDQDALLNSDLSIVDTQLAILNTLLDYFVVFSETPCGFNRK